MYVKIRAGAARQLDVLVHLLVARALLDAGHPLPPSLRKFKVDFPAQLVDASTRAGAVLHGRLASQPAAAAKRTVVAHFARPVQKPHLKAARKWRQKKDIMREIVALPHVGEFLAPTSGITGAQ